METKHDSGTRAVGGWNLQLDEWFTPGRFLLLLGLLIIAAFPDVVFGNQSFVFRDFGLFSYPVAKFHRECFWQGELPLWNPYNNCGIPFLAQWNTIALYPGALIYLLLPLQYSLSLFCLLHLCLAGLGMYLLAHRWVDNRFAAAVAGVVFAFNGLSLNLLMWPSHVATYAWMPWVIWSVERAWQAGGRRIVWAALIGALQMLSGGPETILLTWAMLLIFWLAQLMAGKWPRWRMTARFLLVIVLVAGLAAVQLLPFLDLFMHSQREVDYASTTSSIPLTGWGNLLVPLFGCFLTRKGVYFQDNQNWTSSYYLGTATIALAVLAAYPVRRRRVSLLAGVAVFGLVMALGEKGFFYAVIRKVLPQIGFINYPIKFVLLAVFALPLLAGFGAHQVQELFANSHTRTRRLLFASGLAFAGLIVIIVSFAFFYPQAGEVWLVTLKSGASSGIFLIAILCAFAFAGLLPGRRTQLLFRIAVLALFWLDILTHAPRQTLTAPRAVFQPGVAEFSPRPELWRSRAMIRPGVQIQMLTGTTGDAAQDFLLLRHGLFLDCNLLDDIPTVNGFYSLYPREEREVRALLAPDADWSRLADFLAVCQVTASDDIFKWSARSNYLPLITGGQKPVFANPANTLRSLIQPEFDPRHVVFLGPGAKPSISVGEPSEVKISAGPFSTQRIQFTAQTTQPALVVVAQTYYHWWRALVNDTPVPLHRANHNFEAIQVPAGLSEVQLVYQDGGLRAGAVISSIALLSCVAVWVGSRRFL